MVHTFRFLFLCLDSGSNAGYWTVINFQLSSKQCEEKGGYVVLHM